MSNYEKYVEVFRETFELGSESVDNLEYQGIDSWDSVGHMALIAALEDAFDIMMETDVYGEALSYEAAVKTLRRNNLVMKAEEEETNFNLTKTF